MSKILIATANASGLVTADGKQVPAAEVLSEGKQASTGLLFIDGDKLYFMPSSATDIASTIEKAVDALTSVADAVTKIATTFTAVGAGMAGPSTAPPPTLPADVTAITGYATEIQAAITELNTLKGALK